MPLAVYFHAHDPYQTVYPILVLLASMGCHPEPSISVENLVAFHCGTCHQVPKADALPTSIWQDYVLPHMGARLGIYGDAPFSRDSMLGSEPGYLDPLFPEIPLLTMDDWDRISTYFLSNSHQVVESDSLSVSDQSLNARLHPIPSRTSSPATTLVAPLSDGFFAVGNANEGSFAVLNPDMRRYASTALVGEGAVDVTESNDAFIVTVMGSFSPVNTPSGYLLALPKNMNAPPVRLIDSLHRPVDAAFADLNQDGFFDVVVCEYGKWVGRLSLWTNLGNNRDFHRQILWPEPGATQVEVVDEDGDGDLDLMVMFAQGREAIRVFRQEADGSFSSELLIEFPPSWGGTGFRYQDMTGNGEPDLLVFHGDNADYPPFTKPYQGIRLYSQSGDTWQEEWFIHFPGVYEVIPFDYDLDQDLDLAAISFFPDTRCSTPVSAGVFINQGGEYEFRSLPQLSQGRWMVMDTMDLGADGDLDLVLGSLLFDTPDRPEWVSQWQQSNAAVLLVENLTVE